MQYPRTERSEESMIHGTISIPPCSYLSPSIKECVMANSTPSSRRRNLNERNRKEMESRMLNARTAHNKANQTRGYRLVKNHLTLVAIIHQSVKTWCHESVVNRDRSIENPSFLKSLNGLKSSSIMNSFRALQQQRALLADRDHW